MTNIDLYRAENDYRREQMRRDWRPLRSRRAARIARNENTRNGSASERDTGLAS
ncbi:MAG TPA: hypothetical protein VFE15_07265 [Marmoricola sp.]|jgi:hypothetical protein|nr:hypothetical protein [Marmoricola sp.]